MPQTVEPPAATLEPAPNRKRWTRRECDRLRESGFLQGAYELINGDIINKLGQKPSHRSAVILLRDWLIAIFGGPRVQCQAPVLLNDADDSENEPEPDVAVTARAATEYVHRNPTADEITIVCEVSDSTLRFDMTEKAALYARAGIPEYWIVDIVGKRVLVFRAPISGRYTEISSHDPDEAVSVVGHPTTSTQVSHLLPPER